MNGQREKREEGGEKTNTKNGKEGKEGKYNHSRGIKEKLGERIGN